MKKKKRRKSAAKKQAKEPSSQASNWPEFKLPEIKLPDLDLDSPAWRQRFEELDKIMKEMPPLPEMKLPELDLDKLPPLDFSKFPLPNESPSKPQKAKKPPKKRRAR